MKISFLSRFLAFTLSFWLGSVVAVSVLTFIEVAASVAYIFHAHFLHWLLDGIRYDIFPFALTEMFRSPIMGCLFILLGKRYLDHSAIIRFGAICGASSYVVADLLNLLGCISWSLAPYFRQPLAMYIMLGLPVALILLSRFNAMWKLSTNSPETDPSTRSE